MPLSDHITVSFPFSSIWVPNLHILLSVVSLCLVWPHLCALSYSAAISLSLILAHVGISHLTTSLSLTGRSYPGQSIVCVCVSCVITSLSSHCHSSWKPGHGPSMIPSCLSSDCLSLSHLSASLSLISPCPCVVPSHIPMRLIYPWLLILKEREVP